MSFMGDSITQAGGYLRLTAYVLSTQAARLNIPPFTNAGIGGQKAENMEPRFEKDMKLGEKPAWVFISVGVNDVWHRMNQPHDPRVLEAYEINVRKMVEQGQAAGCRVVLLTPTIIQEDPDSEENKRLASYVEAMKRIAAEKKCAIVDLHGLFLKAMANRKTPVKFTKDGVHMAACGDAIMAIGVLRAMGVSDDTIGATDVTPILKVRGGGVDTTTAAHVLEVPVTRFARPELLSILEF